MEQLREGDEKREREIKRERGRGREGGQTIHLFGSSFVEVAQLT